jgi:SPP1 family predicted phage head-tail adaptor
MFAGPLDRRITLQRATTAQDDTGQEVQTWADLATVWASKRDVSDSERVAAAEVSASITTRFQIRWDTLWSDLNPKDRVACDGKTYDIFGVKELGRREGLEITAAARADW